MKIIDYCYIKIERKIEIEHLLSIRKKGNLDDII